MIAHQTIEELLEAPEGERYQFKEWKNKGDYDDTLKICSALANSGGGKFVIGISDKRPRKVVGTSVFPQPERTRLNIMNKLGINIDFHIYQHENGRVLVFNVASRPKGLLILAPDGAAWWYRADRLEIIPDNVRRVVYEECGHDFTAEICPGATIHDLDNNAIEDFRKRWFNKSNNIRIKNLQADQLLLDCEAITGIGVTFAALILFGTHAALRKYLSQAEVIFEYRSNETPGQAQQREEFRVGFFSYYDKIWELINLRNDLQNYQDGIFILDIPTFNERVARESLLNAVSHRNYQLGGSIFVRQYRNRLVIESPGGFPTGITVENILNRQYPRNRLIASIFALCGLVERSGQGMDLIYELSIRESKSLPDFGDSDDYFTSLTLNGLILDNRMFTILNRIGDKNLELFTINDFLIIDALLHERKISDNLKKHIKRLVNLGIVKLIGRSKYVLVRSFYEVTGRPSVHYMTEKLDRDSYKELIKKHLEINKEKGTALKEFYHILPNHNRSQIQVLLREMRRDNIIRLEGVTSSARWYLT